MEHDHCNEDATFADLLAGLDTADNPVAPGDMVVDRAEDAFFPDSPPPYQGEPVDLPLIADDSSVMTALADPAAKNDDPEVDLFEQAAMLPHPGSLDSSIRSSAAAEAILAEVALDHSFVGDLTSVASDAMLSTSPPSPSLRDLAELNHQPRSPPASPRSSANQNGSVSRPPLKESNAGPAQLPGQSPNMKEKRDQEMVEFPDTVVGDISGITSAIGRKMTNEERRLMLHRRKLRNRQSAERSRRRRQKTIEELQEEMLQLAAESEAILVHAEETRAKVDAELEKHQKELEEARERDRQKKALIDDLTSKVAKLEVENAGLRSLPDEVDRLAGENALLLAKIQRERRLMGMYTGGSCMTREKTPEPRTARVFGG